jgi:hypothetical protein
VEPLLVEAALAAQLGPIEQAAGELGDASPVPARSNG